MLAAGQRGVPCASLHAAAGQGRGLRQRPRRQGPGAADGAGAARAARSPAARPCGRRARRGDLPHERGAAARRRWPDDRAARGRGRRPARRPRRRRPAAASATGSPSRPRRCATCPRVGAPSTLHTHLVVRDDALLLYGFATEEERDLFLLLVGVQAVGPKMALAVLSGGPPRELLGAVAAGDTARLQAAPGHRQADRGADRRRAAREGRRRRARRPDRHHPRGRPADAGPRRAASGSASRRRRPTRCSTARPATRPRT